MNKTVFLTSFLGIGVLSFFLYRYIEEQNQVTTLLLTLPQIEKQLHEVEEENARLRFVIERWENPAHLLELARQSEYAHLKMPITSQVIALVQEPVPVRSDTEATTAARSPSLAIAAK